MIFRDVIVSRIGYGTVYGSTALKSLQNDNIPELDLLVREAIQNSSDAAIRSPYKNFYVNFQTGEFSPKRLNAELRDIGPVLQKNMGKKSASFLEIRDKRTCGLTGPYRLEDINADDHGNYFKLIFDTGKKQDQKGAGGNWGFGKSVYYRASSTGLVIFYSHIVNKVTKEDEHRLIATMIEDENAKNTSLLRTIDDKATGRAWWGRKEINDDGEEEILPITDKAEIKKFLDIFDLSLFKDKDSGTSVIIPYVDEARLLSNVIPKDCLSEDELKQCVWRTSIEKYLVHAIKKWYAPKLFNKHLEEIDDSRIGRERWIRASVNGEVIENDEDMGRFFQLIQELYNCAFFACKQIDYHSKLFPNIDVKKINMQQKQEHLEKQLAGCVAFIKLTNAELYPGYSSLSPYILTGNFINKDDQNEPIIAFAREPGMVISYKIDGAWVKGIPAPEKNPGSPNDTYVIAFFVPNVWNRFTDTERKPAFTDLGGYLRECEGSDHIDWIDKSSYRTVAKIQNHIRNKITESVKAKETFNASPSTTSRLSSRLGRFFMPPDGYGKSSGGGGGGGGGGGFGKTGRFETGEVSYDNGMLKIPFVLPVGDTNNWVLSLDIRTEGGYISPDKWADDIGPIYPAQIEKAQIAIARKDNSRVNAWCSQKEVFSDNSDVLKASFANDKTIRNARLNISCSVSGQKVVGLIWLSCRDKRIECQIRPSKATLK